jgi:hypothetical protein
MFLSLWQIAALFSVVRSILKFQYITKLVYIVNDYFMLTVFSPLCEVPAVFRKTKLKDGNNCM